MQEQFEDFFGLGTITALIRQADFYTFRHTNCIFSRQQTYMVCNEGMKCCDLPSVSLL